MEKADMMSVVKEFTKEELLSIADELDIEVEASTRAIDIVNIIIVDFDKNGIPEPEDEATSELMLDFMYVTGFIEDDEAGDEEEVEDDDDDDIDDGQVDIVYRENEIIQGGEQRFPVCFGYADDRRDGDPACRKCAVYSLCLDKRKSMRPACFGILFERTNEDCIACLEAHNCRAVFESK